MADAPDDLVMQFRPRIRARARQLLWVPGLADDACQETVLRVLQYFRSGRRLQNPASLTAFVYAVCHNVVQEMNRKVHRQIPETWDAPDLGADPHDMLVSEERKQLVRRVLARLPARERELLRLAMIEEVDKAVLCRRFGVSEEYLRVLLYRARQCFRSELQKMERERTRATSGTPAFDAGYIAGLREGDPAVEAHFVEYFRRPILATASRQLRSPDLVEDVCRQTVLRVLQYFRDGGPLNDPASLPSFVRSLCRNVIRETAEGLRGSFSFSE